MWLTAHLSHLLSAQDDREVMAMMELRIAYDANDLPRFERVRGRKKSRRGSWGWGTVEQFDESEPLTPMRNTRPPSVPRMPPQTLEHKPNHILDDSFMAVYIEELRRRMREQVSRRAFSHTAPCPSSP